MRHSVTMRRQLPTLQRLPFGRCPPFLEIRLSPDIGQSVFDLASMVFALLWFQDEEAREAPAF